MAQGDSIQKGNAQIVRQAAAQHARLDGEEDQNLLNVLLLHVQ